MGIDKRLRKTHPALWIPTVYFAMGLPFVAISTSSTLMFKNLGISDAQITFWTSLIMLPWTFKPLWSPFLEIFKTKKVVVITTQLVSGVFFGLAALSLPLDDFFKYSVAILGVVALSGSTHDIATDGVYLNVLSSGEQAKYIGWQGAAYNLAKILTGGALVYLAGQLEISMGVTSAWMVIMGLYSGVMIAMAIYHMRMIPGENTPAHTTKINEAWGLLLDVIKTFFKKKHIVWYVVFIILYRFAEGFAIKIAPLFFKAAREHGGLGLTTSQIGIVYGVFGAAAFVLGSLLGGYFISDRGLKRSLLFLCAAFNIPFVAYALLAWFQPHSLIAVGTAVVFEYFGYGFGFVGLMLFMMQQVARGPYNTAHYAFASGIMNLGFMIPSMMSGYLSDIMGYKLFFILVLAATIPSFLVSAKVPFEYPDNDRQ
jgi:PAT family beta-lactamase induction signal transducer AmpG